MGFGLFKKIKDALKSAGRFIKDKVLTPDNVKKAIDLGTKLAPLIGGAVSTATSGNPMPGLKAGHIAQGIGNNLGFGLN